MLEKVYNNDTFKVIMRLGWLRSNTTKSETSHVIMFLLALRQVKNSKQFSHHMNDAVIVCGA